MNQPHYLVSSNWRLKYALEFWFSLSEIEIAIEVEVEPDSFK